MSLVRPFDFSGHNHARGPGATRWTCPRCGRQHDTLDKIQECRARNERGPHAGATGAGLCSCGQPMTLAEKSTYGRCENCAVGSSVMSGMDHFVPPARDGQIRRKEIGDA